MMRKKSNLYFYFFFLFRELNLSHGEDKRQVITNARHSLPFHFPFSHFAYVLPM